MLRVQGHEQPLAPPQGQCVRSGGRGESWSCDGRVTTAPPDLSNLWVKVSLMSYAESHMIVM